MAKRNQENLDVFERKVVFRTARSYFLIIAIGAILTFFGGVALGVSGLVRPHPSEPAEPAMPPAVERPAPMTLADIETHLASLESEDDVEEIDEPDFALSDSDSMESDKPTENRVKALIERLKKLFPEPDYSWSNRYETVCLHKSAYGCLRRDRKLVQRGIVEILNEGLSERERNDEETLVQLLEDVVHVLEKAPLERRGELMVAALETHRKRWQDYRVKSLLREREVNELRAGYEAAIAERDEEIARLESEKDEQLWTGVYGVLVGLGALVFVGVFLAHLAIERHLRELREIMLSTGKAPRPTDSDKPSAA